MLYNAGSASSPTLLLSIAFPSSLVVRKKSHSKTPDSPYVYYISIINTRWAKTDVTIEFGRLKLIGIMCADAI